MVVAGPFLYAPAIYALDTPETAMRGFDRVDAGSECLVILIGLCAVLCILALVRFVLRRRRVVALVPILALLPTYVLFEVALAELERVPGLHQRFRMSQSELDRVADEVSSGRSPPFPARVGSFEIVRAERLASGSVVLYTKIGPSTNGRWGFVRSAGQAVDAGEASLVGLADDVGVYSRLERMTGDWFVLFDLLTFVKRGWS